MNHITTETFSVFIDGIKITGLNIFIDGKNPKQIISIPSQIGCNNQCSFCISKNQPLIRNLNHKEILLLIDKAKIYHSNIEISFTGEGEPLHNLKNINHIIENSSHSAFKIAFSGLGSHLISKISQKEKVTLQFSLHHANPVKRKQLIPKTDDLSIIRTNLLEYQNQFKQININYVIIPGINDSAHDFEHLNNFNKDSTFNLIFNPLLEMNTFTLTDPKPLEYKNIKIYKNIAQSITKNKLYKELTYQS